MSAERGQPTFGFKLPNCGGILCPPTFARPELVRELTAAADATGYDSVWMQDHLVTPPELRDLGELPFLEPLITGASLAASHPRLTIGIATIILPFREPVLLAKQLTTFEALFPGRLIAGFGSGRYPGEFEAIGIPWEDRGQRSNEYLQIVELVSSQAQATYSGRFRTLEAANMTPRPPSGRLQIWVGGGVKAALRRAARHGTGWIGAALGPDEVRNHIATLRTDLADQGRNPADFHFALSTTIGASPSPESTTDGVHRHSRMVAGRDEEIVGALRAYREAGITDFLIAFDVADETAVRERIAWFAEGMIPQVRIQ